MLPCLQTQSMVLQKILLPLPYLPPHLMLQMLLQHLIRTVLLRLQRALPQRVLRLLRALLLRMPLKLTVLMPKMLLKRLRLLRLPQKIPLILQRVVWLLLPVIFMLLFMPLARILRLQKRPLMLHQHPLPRIMLRVLLRALLPHLPQKPLHKMSKLLLL